MKRRTDPGPTGRWAGGLLAAAVWLTPLAAAAQNAPAADASPRLDIYGFAMLDMGYEANTNDPLWFDTVRPTKLPSFDGEFAPDGHWFAGVRQSRLGVKAFVPTALGELRTIFEFEMFGTGVDAGQTTIRLRHAWGELGHFGAGQSWSPFMDIDVFPNSVEYWGPNGMAFFRNVQVRWTPWMKPSGSNFQIALERPGASADQGNFAGRIELEDVRAHFPLPDLSSHVRVAGGWGHVQLAGIVRWMEWEDLNGDQFDLSGDATGWGINLSSNLKFGARKHILKLSVLYGEGIQNYLNDAPVDVGIEHNFGNPRTPVVGKALPILGLVAFLDLNWAAKWTSTLGYSMVDIDNSSGQSPSAFKKGHYALANVLYYPVPDVFFGPEVQWGKRENFSDGFSSDDLRVQFSVKYSFKHQFGGK